MTLWSLVLCCIRFPVDLWNINTIILSACVTIYCEIQSLELADHLSVPIITKWFFTFIKIIFYGFYHRFNSRLGQKIQVGVAPLKLNHNYLLLLQPATRWRQHRLTLFSTLVCNRTLTIRLIIISSPRPGRNITPDDISSCIPQYK